MKAYFVLAAFVGACFTAEAMPRDPAFDCSGATLSSGEKAVCASDDLGWYDRQLVKLLGLAGAASGADAAALKGAQDAFVAGRNACGEKDFACARKAYQERLAELAAAAGSPDIALSEYAAKSGSVSILSYPGNTAALRITTVNADNHSCTFQSDAETLADGGAMVHADAASSGGKTCKIAVTPGGDGVSVAATDCETYCGVGVTMDGTYPKGAP